MAPESFTASLETFLSAPLTPASPFSQEVRSKAQPSAARRASARAVSAMPERLPEEASSAKAVCSRPASMAEVSPVSLVPGPTSRNIRRPEAYIFSIIAVNSTGEASCQDNISLTLSAESG